MSPEVAFLLGKAHRSLDAARLLLESGSPDFAVSRAYYAAFHAAEAFLLARDLSFSRHSAVIAEFGRRAVKESGLPPELHRVLIDAYESRNVADYGHEGVGADAADRMIGRVLDFVAAVERSLENAP